ncbi:MAG: branched-chain alpha-keto acid dehydrogenase subunit E2 [Blastocatellia bacterium]|nr:MAG: branched-chain alpha-keto acid dehydrogenase subunit E2 [Blastocatellia bacterium]
MSDFSLPELGENIETGDVLRVLVQPGDTVSKDQPVIELETDKATIEVPSSVAGRVTEVKVKAGDKVKVGQPILTVQESGAGSQAVPAAAEEAPQRSKPSPSDEKSGEEIPEEGAIKQHVEGKRAGKVDEPDVAESEEERGTATPLDRAEEVAASGQRPRSGGGGADKVVDFSRGRTSAEAPAAQELPPAPAAPSVRRMARELGVDINDVPGSGPGGRISSDDVKAHVSRLVTGAAAHSAASVPSLPDFSRWGEIERQPMSAIRRKTAAHLAVAWASIPHVTQHDVADITLLEDLRRRYTKSVEKAGGNLTVTAIAVKIVAAALKVFPQFNASIDIAANEIVYKKYVHIGIAVDTDRGLLVPVIRDADTKNITDVAIELTHLSERARAGKLTLEEMQGGCFSISNLGGIGGTAFTPIVNAPDVAILGISRARIEPVWRPATDRAHAADDQERDGLFVPRTMLPLSLSYDHRAVDGADGIRFLRWVVEALEQPFLLSLQG